MELGDKEGALKDKETQPGEAVAPEVESAHARIAKRAYEIAQSGDAEGDLDNWLRAERELTEVASKPEEETRRC